MPFQTESDGNEHDSRRPVQEAGGRFHGAGLERFLPGFLALALQIATVGPAEPAADAVLMASITHFDNYTITQMKEYLRDRGLPMNL